MSESTILEALKVYRKYINGDESHVEVAHVPVNLTNFDKKYGETEKWQV
ncbi:MAG: hypothetical protein ACIRZZ_09690 [Lactobacillus gallinarum]